MGWKGLCPCKARHGRQCNERRGISSCARHSDGNLAATNRSRRVRCRSKLDAARERRTEAGNRPTLHTGLLPEPLVEAEKRLSLANTDGAHRQRYLQPHTLRLEPGPRDQHPGSGASSVVSRRLPLLRVDERRLYTNWKCSPTAASPTAGQGDSSAIRKALRVPRHARRINKKQFDLFAAE